MAKHFSYKAVTTYLTPELWQELDNVRAHEGHTSQSAVLRKLLQYGVLLWKAEQRAIRGEQRAT